MHDSNFILLKGLTLTSLALSAEKDVVNMTTAEGRRFRLYHDQDCCESVIVDSVAGDLDYLFHTPILEATEVVKDNHETALDDSETITIFTLTTAKGTVVITWNGTSNGYYSESVSFVEL